jgi:hypothetical protein
LGHLRIDPYDWPRWTLRDFELAYKAWVEVNVNAPWERARAISFYILKPNDTKGVLNKWSDVFELAIDKKKKKPNIFIRKMTAVEIQEFDKITGEKSNE